MKESQTLRVIDHVQEEYGTGGATRHCCSALHGGGLVYRPPLDGIIEVVNKDLFMPRPRNKQDLLKAGEEYYAKLIEMADSMSEKEMNTEFDFSGDPSKKERHWGRDKNLRDIWVTGDATRTYAIFGYIYTNGTECYLNL